MKTREQVIEELKSAGLWNEDAVKSNTTWTVE